MSTRRKFVKEVAASAALASSAKAQKGTYDVVVVGAGVFGAWTAHHLRKAGKRVFGHEVGLMLGRIVRPANAQPCT